jgi:Lrp/AsnC family leucine-responsive transcriptional regulator
MIGVPAVPVSAVRCDHGNARPPRPAYGGLNLLAFLFVGWSDGIVEAEFLRRIAMAPQVLECHHVTDGWNYLLKVRVTALEGSLANVLKQGKGLQRTQTLIVLSSPKETTELPVSV